MNVGKDDVGTGAWRRREGLYVRNNDQVDECLVKDEELVVTAR